MNDVFFIKSLDLDRYFRIYDDRTIVRTMGSFFNRYEQSINIGPCLYLLTEAGRSGEGRAMMHTSLFKRDLLYVLGGVQGGVASGHAEIDPTWVTDTLCWQSPEFEYLARELSGNVPNGPSV